MAAGMQPGIEPGAVLGGIPTEVIDTQQPCVLPEPLPLRKRRQCPRAQPRNDLALEPGARIQMRRSLRSMRRTQPQPARRVSASELLQQRRAHLRQLMHVLMPIHVGRGTAHGRLKSVQLARHLRAQSYRVQLVQVSPRNQVAQGLAVCGVERALRQVQVQPHLYPACACYRKQAPRAFWPRRAAHHGRHRLYPPLARQSEHSLIDTGVQAKVVHTKADAAPTAMLARTTMIRYRPPHHPQVASTQRGRIGWFVVVGCAAAAVHWSVATGMVAFAHWAPLQANVVGWVVALMVSFTGHHRLSFRGHGASIGSAGLRFLCISGGGFLVNEIAYALLLRWTAARYDLLLACVLVSVAGATYLLSRHWAFLRSAEH